MEAERIYRQILAVDADQADSLHLLGMIAHQRGSHDAAVEMIRKAIEISPNQAAYHSNLGTIYHVQGKLDEAAACFERALVLKPDWADVHSNFGNILEAQGKLDEAVACQERALALKPDFAEAYSNLGNARQAQGKLNEAVACYERALALRPDYADAHNNLGSALMALDRIEDAAAHYERALILKPDYANSHNNLANIFKTQGRFEEAMKHYDRAIAIKPDYAEAHYSRSEVKVFHSGDADLVALEALANWDDLTDDKALYIHFALAKALEDSGDYVRAFEHLRKGNALKRRRIDYDEMGVLKLFQRLASAFDKDALDRFEGQGDSSSVPVFVLGMARSGSTLIEQILASHPQIQAAGELPTIEKMTAGNVLNAGQHSSQYPAIQYPEVVPHLDGATLRRLGQSYLARLPALADGKVRIIDKMPGNFLHIGLIRLILPNARIIHSMRHPIDTCVSCYSKLFTSGLDFTHDLGELGRYYRCYSELMDHWRLALPPGAMLDVRYEDVVDDLEGQARRLIDYCGLPWDDRCLNFHRTSRPVKTASAVQVRKPLFRSSLERWRYYEANLTPLLDELRGII